MDPSSIKKNQPRVMNIDIVREIIENHGGKLLTEEYLNSRQKFEIKCSVGHIFYKKYSKIEDGYWCPMCNANCGEAITREILCIYFGVTFPKVRPKWLEGLELDGYNENLKLAFEYDGQQHYKYIEKFHVTFENFIHQKERDIRKNKLCKENNVILIRVPYIIKNTKIAGIYVKYLIIKLSTY